MPVPERSSQAVSTAWHTRWVHAAMRLWHRASLLLPLWIVLAGLAVHLADPAPLRAVQHLVFDQFQRWHPRATEAAPVRIVDIDDESIRRLGQWPWPRTRIAELTARLQQAGASAIGFDVLFSEADRTSPAAMADAWHPGPSLRQALDQLPDPDRVLADTLRQGRVVLGFAQGRAAAGPGPSIHPKARFVTLDAPALDFVPRLDGGLWSLPMLDAAAAGQGALNFVPDADGVVRRVPTLVRQGDTLLPSLSMEMLRVAQGTRTITTHAIAGVGMTDVRVGNIQLATTETGEVWLHYAHPVPGRYLPAWEVLAGTLPLEELRGGMVLVGASAQGLMDLRFSALGTVMPGVEIHAQLLDQMLAGQGLDRPSWIVALEAVLLAASGWLAGTAAIRMAPLRAAVAGGGLVAVLGTAAWLAFVRWHLLLSPVMPVLVALAAFGVCSVAQHVRVERRQRWIRQAFARYVSPNLVSHLVRHPESLRLGGRRQECSFLFTDLEGFTHTMEGMDPGEAVAMVNGYLDGMIAIAFAHQGTLTRIVGDGLAILFSAPLVQVDHARRAVACALEMQAFAQQYAARLQAAHGMALGRTRMGVHSGEVIVGNFGGSTLFDYRALGDPVNTAARLEGANRFLGTSICISEAVARACPDLAARPIGRLMLVGKSVPVTVFEPQGFGRETDERYLEAYALVQRSAPEALHDLEALAHARPQDRLVAMHLARLRAGQTGDLIVLEAK